MCIRDRNIGAYFIELFLGERREVFYEACLDAKGKLLACYRLAEGSPDQVTINMRRVVENALNANASLVVLSHNHPSGVALPSKEDNQTTLQIKRALADIGVQLVDHVIVADGDFVCPVSYTHLDVYKRQALRRTGRTI